MTAVWDHPAVARGIRVQEQLLQDRLHAGEDVIGWKVGVGTPAAMQRVGISAPLVGFLLSGAVVTSGATVSLRGWVKPALEPEIAIHIGRDLGPDASQDEAGYAIAGLAPAIELANLDVPLTDLERVVGGNIFHRHVILGDPDLSRQGGHVSGMRVRVLRGTEEIGATDDPTASTGKLTGLVAHVADWLAHRGRRLEAGQVIISGSVIPVVPVEPGDVIEYHCEPLGQLRVGFAA